MVVSWRSASMRGAGCFDLGGDFDGRQCEGVAVVDTQRGQVCIQPAAEGGMVRGPRVGGEQLPGMGGTRVDAHRGRVRRPAGCPRNARRADRAAGPPAGQGCVKVE